VGAGGIVVGVVLGGDSKYAAFLDYIQELLCAADEFFVESDDVDLSLVVLPDGEEVAVAEEVVEFAAVYLEEGDHHLQVAVLRLNYTICYLLEQPEYLACA
jgi:hypothetical protein